MAYGIRCSRKRVARLMRPMGLQGAHRRPNRGLTRRDPRRPVFPDRVQRVFAADVPNRLWVADLTQHPTDEGWLYLATVLEAFSRRVAGCPGKFGGGRWRSTRRPGCKRTCRC